MSGPDMSGLDTKVDFLSGDMTSQNLIRWLFKETVICSLYLGI